jgi:hypothetical protein
VGVSGRFAPAYSRTAILEKIPVFLEKTTKKEDHKTHLKYFCYIDIVFGRSFYRLARKKKKEELREKNRIKKTKNLIPWRQCSLRMMRLFLEILLVLLLLVPPNPLFRQFLD